MVLGINVVKTEDQFSFMDGFVQSEKSNKTVDFGAKGINVVKTLLAVLWMNSNCKCKLELCQY